MRKSKMFLCFSHFLPFFVFSFLVNLQTLGDILNLIRVHNHALFDVDLANFLRGGQHLCRTNAIVKKLVAIIVILVLIHTVFQLVVASKHIRNLHRVVILVNRDIVNRHRNDIPLCILLHHHLQVGNQAVAEHS